MDGRGWVRVEEMRLVQVREDGGLNSGDSTRGGVKWTDLGYILKAHPRGADIMGYTGSNYYCTLFAHFISTTLFFLLLLKHFRHVVIPRPLQLLLPLPGTLSL